MKWAFIIFMVLYALALALYVVGTYGLFGSQEGPLAGVFLVPLGLPWNFLLDKAGLAGPVAGVLSPAINAALLYWLWKR